MRVLLSALTPRLAPAARLAFWIGAYLFFFYAGSVVFPPGGIAYLRLAYTPWTVVLILHLLVLALFLPELVTIFLGASHRALSLLGLKISSSGSRGGMAGFFSRLFSFLNAHSHLRLASALFAGLMSLVALHPTRFAEPAVLLFAAAALFVILRTLDERVLFALSAMLLAAAAYANAFWGRNLGEMTAILLFYSFVSIVLVRVVSLFFPAMKNKAA